MRTKLTVKWSDPAKAKATATLKTTGAIDVIRPGTSVTVTPTVKNCYTYTPKAADLRVLKLVGKTYTDVTDTAKDPFTVKVEDGKFVVTQTGAVNTKTDKFQVKLAAEMDGVTVESKPVALSVKMGAAKLTQNVKTVNLLKTDRYSSGVVKLSTADGTLAPITKVVLVSPTDKAKKPLFELTDLGNGAYAIHYAGNVITTAKAATVKLQVYLEGNNTGSPNATLSVSVKLQ